MSIDIHKHFHPEERSFIDKALEWIQKADQFHEVKRTDFLDPRQQFILQTLVNRYPNLQLRLNGGYADAERKRAWIAQDYKLLDEEDIGIQVLSITSDDIKLESLDHGDFMGAILGLGIKRDKIGDIHVHEQGCHCLVAGEIIQYFYLQLHQVHRVHVQTDILPIEQLQYKKATLAEMNLIVASLRLDGIVSDVVRMSRSKIMAPIKAGHCRINWKVETDPSKTLKEGDMVSLKGFGRFKVLKIDGITKKGRIHVLIGKFV